MKQLSADEIVALFLGLGLLLAVARILGGLARRAHQPALLGEILAGVLLGPSVLGRLFPEHFEHLFSPDGPRALVHDGLSVLAITLFLMVAGLEVDLSTMWRQGKVAVCVGLLGVLLPFAIGLGSTWIVPDALGIAPGASSLAFSLFFATALSISALPLIAKTLMDLGLYRTDFGMLIIAAAIFNDLVGWIVFAIVIGLGGTAASDPHRMGIGSTIWLVLVFALVMLTIGRAILDRALRLIQSKPRSPGAVMSFALTGTMFCAAFTEWIGVHAIFGAFLFGVALGDSSNLREQTRSTIERFISYFFAPIFFSGIGLQVDFVSHFDLGLSAVVITIACIGKILGCGLGARIGGMSWPEAWAVGFGMNARGAMEIILGLLALQIGLIREPMFVALVTMALVTSILSGPAIQALLRPRTGLRSFTEHMPIGGFVGPLQVADRWQAIVALASAAAQLRGLDAEQVAKAVTVRERTLGTGLPNGIAIPHGRMPRLEAPIVVAGTSSSGIDFDAADGNRAQIIFLILTSEGDGRSQLEILADIAATFPDRAATLEFVGVRNHAEFVARARLQLLRRRESAPRLPAPT